MANSCTLRIVQRI